MKNGNGQVVCILRHKLIRDAVNRTVLIRKMSHNFRTQNKFEYKQREKENQFRDCLENMVCSIGLYSAVRDKEGKIIDFVCRFVNNAKCAAYGKTKDELLGRCIGDIWDDEQETFMAECCRVCETGEPYSNEAFHYNCRYNPQLSGIYELHVSKWGDGIAVSSRNISAKKNMEAQMARLERLNLIGEMAASLGHEIRNPLTTVRGYLQWLQRKEKYAEHHEQFSMMLDEIDKANAVINEYLTLAKNKAVEFKLTNINQIITELMPLLQASALHYGHAVKLELSSVPDITLDEKEIRQLILNLVRNSYEAMNSQGTVTIKTYIKNDVVLLAINDTGPGISDEVLSKLGNPFVTTKENGTGLGLAVCYRIAERHGAKIEIETSCSGTIVFVKFQYLK